MTSPDEIDHYPHQETYDPDGVINPGFIEVVEDRTIQTRDLEPGITTTIGSSGGGISHSSSSLPDILNSHLPPPYEAVVVETNPRRRRRRQETDDKSCCRNCWTSLTRFKWLLWTLSSLGICCALAGVVLGALHMTGSSFMMLSIMFIGLGIIMIVVVLIGWRCTPRGHEPCHLLFNLGEFSRTRRRHGSSTSGGSRSGRRRDPGRRTYWSGGVIYSDHQYRQPPPSYAAAMQDFERQLLARMSNLEPVPNSPPPTYKSHASLQRPGMRSIFPDQPPTYSSRPGTLRPSVQQNNLDNDTQRCERNLNVTHITVHRDNVSRESVEDNLTYYGTLQGQVGTSRESTVERAVVHSTGRAVVHGTDSALRYGTAERSAVHCLEESIRGGEGVVNTSMVLEENNRTEAERTRGENDRGGADNRSKNDVLMNTASLLRAADQNLQRLRSRNDGNIRSARFIPGSEPRYGSARASSQHRHLIGHISHMRSSSASGVDFHYQEHIATLV